MGVASLVLAIIAIVFGILPMIYTQLVGIVVGILALVMGIWARRQSTEQGHSTRVATTGLILGIIATLLSGLLYAAFLSSGNRVRDEMVRHVGSEFQDPGQGGNKEFRAAMKKAIERARAHQQSGAGAAGKVAPKK